jgi:hypothetical protein
MKAMRAATRAWAVWVREGAGGFEGVGGGGGGGEVVTIESPSSSSWRTDFMIPNSLREARTSIVALYLPVFRPNEGELSMCTRRERKTYAESEVARVADRDGRERDERALGRSGRSR